VKYKENYYALGNDRSSEKEEFFDERSYAWKIDTDIIFQVLSPKEKDNFLRELYNVALNVVRTEKSEYIEEMRLILLSWEYTAAVKSNKDFLDELEATIKEIDEDHSPGVDWRELLQEKESCYIVNDKGEQIEQEKD